MNNLDKQSTGAGRPPLTPIFRQPVGHAAGALAEILIQIIGVRIPAAVDDYVLD